MSAATARVNKRANAAAPDEAVGGPRFDPAAVTFEASEVVDKNAVKPSRAAKFGDDHPLFLDYKASYEKEEAHRLVGDPDTLVKALRKIAGQLETGVRILSQDETSVTYLAQPKRTRRTAEQIAADSTVADEEATAE